MKTYAIIPARYGSTRFPGKPLAPIAGRTMIERVYAAASRARGLAGVAVATDDERIAQEVERFGGRVVMTRPDHASGTDRLAEAAGLLGARDEDIVVNVQGDQPGLAPGLIEAVMEPFTRHPGLDMATPVVRLVDPNLAADPNTVKCVFDERGNALYFSRAPIPWPRDGGEGGYFRHIGLYAYRAAFLARFVTWPEGRLERLERLEQLRALENGAIIRVVVVEHAAPDVDTPADIARVEAFLAQGEEK